MTVIESVKRDRVGFLVGEDVAGGTLGVISKFGDSVLHFCSVCRVEVVDLSRAVRTQERNSLTRVTTGLGGPCACLVLTRKQLVSCRPASITLLTYLDVRIFAGTRSCC